MRVRSHYRRIHGVPTIVPEYTRTIYTRPQRRLLHQYQNLVQKIRRSGVIPPDPDKLYVMVGR